MRETFNRWADHITHAVGSPVALFAAAAIIVVWAVTGPLAGFSDTWQLVINTGTTIVTFLMVFVIQSAQNRDSKAVHAKLDELLRAEGGARNRFLVSEQQPEEDLDRDLREMARVAEHDPDAGEPTRRRPRRPRDTGGRSSPAARARGRSSGRASNRDRAA
jgi:low affinity Fe/Cu permease